MIEYKHILTFRMVDFSGNVAYDTVSIMNNSVSTLNETDFKQAQTNLINRHSGTGLASLVVVNDLVLEGI